MRISTANMFDTSIFKLQQRQEQMQDSQMRLTSGKRILKASDDPTAAARAERSLAMIGRVDANQRALEASRNSLRLAESALGDANEVLQQVSESLVAAGNASYSDAERKALASKLAGLRTQLLSVSNRSDGSGGFIFGGQGSEDAPFLDLPGGVKYMGTPGSVQTGTLESFTLNVDGRATWMLARTGNGTFVTASAPNSITSQPAKSWIDAGRVTAPGQLTGHDYQIQVVGSGAGATYNVIDQTTGGAVASGPFISGKAIEFDGMAVNLSGVAEDGDTFNITPSQAGLSVFDVIDQAVRELSTDLRSPIEVAQANTGRLRDIGAVMVNLQNVRSLVGEKLNNLDGSESRMADNKLFSEQERSAAVDLDMVQGISDFQNQQSGYDAALKTYAMVQKMSMFQYVNF